jgi:hypothetical protein
VFLISRLRLVDVLDEVVDGCFLAHMSSLRAFPCFAVPNSPKPLLTRS